ncbi:hypothetical protein PTTG_03741 [Puccinia triticina 1-1 BBBD Race 1]|uniref:Uncharacterized protein n=1 Tax=Puccinia triticina (isolate 1-1 / race 1 (BBBD)) TaxID=630390 RepID=A0A0C4ESG6_PUCT1|nr:hypothetical protein PTTG_03741 [Puccinia triticina 1-1 BBBD Race 1]
MDEIERMLQFFEQRLEQKITAQARPATPCGPMKDKEAKLVEQREGSFFLPNGALIPVDNSRPIQHVVASYNPKTAMASASKTEFRTMCRSLDPWQPPSISSQSFAGTYQANPACKKHEVPKPFKAPAVTPLAARSPAQKVPAPKSGLDMDEMAVEPKLFERVPEAPTADEKAQESSALTLW